MLPLVAIVGRPNVGKSTLFNRLTGERKAIVHDSSGVTRDRHYGESFWNGKDFRVVDTGGYVPDDMDKMILGIREQVELALLEADAIIFVTDVENGVTDLDSAVAIVLRQQDKPVFVASNKSDNEQKSWNASDFYQLGFEKVYPISAMSGFGTGELLDDLASVLPDRKPDPYENIPKIAIIGRPNVGKSSLVNTLLGEDRSIVTDIAGTTRDTINSIWKVHGRSYVLIDTAGLRRKTKVTESVEFYSALRTQKAIMECDIAVLVIDATQGLEAQDIRVLREAEKFNKGIILLLNKWDLIEKENNTLKDFEEKIRDKIPTMSYIPILSISALTKQRTHKIVELVDEVIEERKKSITTSTLNKFIEKIFTHVPLPIVQGSQLKVKYGTQVKSNPPVFAFFMNKPWELPASNRRYIEAQIRKEFGFIGVPITMVFKEK